jgi:hypothetical protein
MVCYWLPYLEEMWRSRSYTTDGNSRQGFLRTSKA